MADAPTGPGSRQLGKQRRILSTVLFPTITTDDKDAIEQEFNKGSAPNKLLKRTALVVSCLAWMVASSAAILTNKTILVRASMCTACMEPCLHDVHAVLCLTSGPVSCRYSTTSHIL